MSSGRIQSAVVGTKDASFGSNPDVTYFIKKFTRHSKFAIETLDVSFDQASPNFDSLLTCTIPRKGHLVRNIYLNLTLPALTTASFDPPSPDSFYVSDRSNTYTDGIGHAIIDYAELLIGGKSIERVNGEYLHIASQSWIDNSRQNAMKEMVGDTSVAPSIPGILTGQPSAYFKYEFHYDTYMYNPYLVYGLRPADRPKKFSVPLTFYFAQSDSLALPLVAITQQEIEVHIKLRPLVELLAGGKMWNPVTPTPLTSFEASLSVEYVFVGEDEIQTIKKTATDYIVTQSQSQEYSVPAEAGTLASTTVPYSVGSSFNNLSYSAVPTGKFIFAYISVDDVSNYTTMRINKKDLSGTDHSLQLSGMIDGVIGLYCPTNESYVLYTVKGTPFVYTYGPDTVYQFQVTFSDSTSPTSNISSLFGAFDIQLSYVDSSRDYNQDGSYDIAFGRTVSPGTFKLGYTSLDQMIGYSKLSVSKYDVYGNDLSAMFGGIRNGTIFMTNQVSYVYYSVTGTASLSSDTYDITIVYNSGSQPSNVPITEFFLSPGVSIQYFSAEYIYKQNGSYIPLSAVTVPSGTVRFGSNSDVNTIAQYNIFIINTTDSKGVNQYSWLSTMGYWIVFRAGEKFAIYFITSRYPYQSGSAFQAFIQYRTSNYPGLSARQLFGTDIVSIEYYNAGSGVLSPINMRLNFINPIKELFFLIQDDYVAKQNNDYFNFYNNGYFTDGLGPVVDTKGDQLKTLELVFNDSTFLSPIVASKIYLGDVQFLNNHTRRPNANMRIYNYSFALDPENPLPTGQVNFSRILNQTLKMQLTSTYNSWLGLYNDRTIRVYARSYNTLRIRDGIASLLFPDKA
jgi:Major capsid protein N-terminus/Large eukaryotic DNA virus major capsid protein